MTSINLMDQLAQFLTVILRGYNSDLKRNQTPIKVYPGYTPIRDRAQEDGSFVYALATEVEDTMEGSKAHVEIGASIYDSDTANGYRSLFNVLEHIRQALLVNRTIGGKHRLQLPMQTQVVEEQPYPQWQGKITCTYSLGQPQEEINHEW